MTLTIGGARNELGTALRQRLADASGGAPPVSAHLHLGGQHANTLLHDGHAWRDFARLLRASTQRALRGARTAEAPLLVHASFAFVHALAHGAVLDAPLRRCADAILEAEARVLAGPVPACVVRLGYLYGPGSADLRAYRSAFRLGRPYWSGDPAARQHHLHHRDAAGALLAAARHGRPGRTYWATDGHPLSFRTLMDDFAHRVGRARPLHLPLRAGMFVRGLIAPEHIQQTALAMPQTPPSPRVPGWRPLFSDHRRGLEDVIDHWRDD